MKTRMGFVSNSSSTAFIITNHTKKVLPLVEFVKETPELVRAFAERYDDKDDRLTQEHMITNADSRGRRR